MSLRPGASRPREFVAYKSRALKARFIRLSTYLQVKRAFSPESFRVALGWRLNGAPSALNTDFRIALHRAKICAYAVVHGHSQSSGGDHCGRRRKSPRARYGNAAEIWRRVPSGTGLTRVAEKFFASPMRRTLRQQNVCIAKRTG